MAYINHTVVTLYQENYFICLHLVVQNSGIHTSLATSLSSFLTYFPYFVPTFICFLPLFLFTLPLFFLFSFQHFLGLSFPLSILLSLSISSSFFPIFIPTSIPLQQIGQKKKFQTGVQQILDGKTAEYFSRKQHNIWKVDNII